MCARSLPLLAAAIALTAAGLAPIPPPKPGPGSKVSLKALEGAWKVIKYETGKANGGLSTFTTYSRVVIKGTTWTQVHSSRTTSSGPSYTFTLDTSKSPAHIDMTLDTSKGKNAGARRGVLELKGDQLTVAYGMVSKDVLRPKSPDDPLAGLQYRWVLRREKP